ncbi:SDR family NAD(P)-dependent oxidoreductase [Streptomyces sp. yr375]|uniref:SDR family NAD(P)-dependent oxidoreductase n=1 Tax=Streptomyces sp. yr375 TaxID=1761906 RepID=UPI00210E0299|nr:SDR family NAD(P)-dependent oxidoreductase [Streptomyces sp. yr375]
MVTGGGTGIGPSTAERLADEGATEVIAGRPEAEPAAAERLGPSVPPVRADVTDNDDRWPRDSSPVHVRCCRHRRHPERVRSVPPCWQGAPHRARSGPELCRLRPRFGGSCRRRPRR